MSLKKMVVGAAILGASFSVLAAVDNVALGKTVSALPGSGIMNHDLSLITDGVMPAEHTNWQEANTVYWNGFAGFEIDLGGSFNVSEITVSHDNNDSYMLTYAQAGSVIYKPFGNTDNGGGMSSSVLSFASPITVSKLSFFAFGGDNMYSMGEVQVMGVAASVPEPESYAMLLAGLGLVGAMARRRRVS